MKPSLRVAATLAGAALTGCEPEPRPPRVYGQWPGAQAAWSQPPYGTVPVETRDPWRSAPGATAASPPSIPVAPAPAPPRAVEPGPFLVMLELRGPGGAARLPDAHATLARLGGVLRTPSLWEVAQQPGGGLGSLAATLERELCAEDIVVVYRARNGGIQRTEFAGHRACREEAPPPAAAPPRAPRPPSSAPTPAPGAPRRDPFHDRF